MKIYEASPPWVTASHCNWSLHVYMYLVGHFGSSCPRAEASGHRPVNGIVPRCRSPPGDTEEDHADHRSNATRRGCEEQVQREKNTGEPGVGLGPQKIEKEV